MEIPHGADDGHIVVFRQGGGAEVKYKFGVDQTLEIVGTVRIHFIDGMVVPRVKVHDGSRDTKVVLFVHDVQVKLSIYPGNNLFVGSRQNAEAVDGAEGVSFVPQVLGRIGGSDVGPGSQEESQESDLRFPVLQFNFKFAGGSGRDHVLGRAVVYLGLFVELDQPVVRFCGKNV